jgi:hypothetical protein
MRKPWDHLFPLLFVIGLTIVALGAIRASSLRPTLAGGNVSAAVQTEGQDQPVRQEGFIGYAGDVLTYHYSAYRQGQNTLESILTPANLVVNGKVLVGTQTGVAEFGLLQ